MRAEFEPFLESIRPESLAMLRRLVEVNSHTFRREGVVSVGEICVELFLPLGFSARRVRSVTAECGDHLVLTRGAGAADTILMVAHLDTVFTEEQERRDAFSWREEGERIYGPGVADIKGGIVLILMILRTLRARAPDLFERVEWKVLLNASEEGACADFPELARSCVTPGARAALVYETGFERPGGASDFVVARKGAGRFRLEAFGREAHSGNAHHEGASALRALARAIEAVESLTDHESGLSFNVGLASGGSSVNSVPHRASGLLDMRAWVRADFENGRARVAEAVKSISLPSHDGNALARVEIHELPGYPPWESNRASEELGALVEQCAAQLDQTVLRSRRRGASDGCNLYDLVPTVDGLGPVGRNTHCSVHDPGSGREQESVDRDSFVPRALLSVALLHRILEETP